MNANDDAKVGPKFATPPGRVHEVVAQLRDERRQRGWSQHKLAVKAGCAVNTVNQVENGRVHNPRLLIVADMAQALGFDLVLQKRT